MDFTLIKYQQLLEALQHEGYIFQTFESYCEGSVSKKWVILRHDVDLRAKHSLAMAHLEAKMGIKASYYFRVVPESNQPEIIMSIAALGHEIGYHYEDLSIFKGDESAAIQHFENQLNYFEQFYPVKTICMHGSPTSRYDNRDIWKRYNYRDFGITGEPYFDINFDEIYYLTDTGRCWDGEKYSVRDKVKSKFDFSFHSTPELINAIETGKLPSKIMITTHPQRWTDNKMEWLLELISQKIKNMIKFVLIRF